MKLSEILNQINTFEKNHFLRVLESLIATKPNNYKRIEKILSEIDGQIKNADNESVEQVLFLLEEEYSLQDSLAGCADR